jgi:Ni/Fe-hydrogenase subunit HybB-like protein
MAQIERKTASFRNAAIISVILVVVGFSTFLLQAGGDHPERAWQAYLINFLLWSSIAQGAFLFSVVMHLAKARWSQPVQNLAESFAAFFPLSLVLFVLLFLGKEYLFPWLHQDLHGKEVWLNIPFLFSRDLRGLVLLYGLGLAYFFYALRCKRLADDTQALDMCRSKMTVFGVLYILAYALVLTLIGFDLVMSMEPHWFSTLFGPYTFVKAFYLGLGALIILSAILRLVQGNGSELSSSHFHDVGKLFFAFCLVWADFFYVQLLVIWYGNIPEETSYVIQRTMMHPWQSLAWAIFLVSFVMPFFVLLSKKVKTKPAVMLVICAVVITGLWLEHLLLLGPALNHKVAALPLGFADGLITLGFFGLMALAVTFFLKRFPELVPVAAGDE